MSRRFYSSLKQQQCLFAGTPGASVIFKPLRSQLLHREMDSVFLKSPDRHHLVVVVVVYGRITVAQHQWRVL